MTELLVVIAIISVLAGILFPVFGRAKAQAKSTACLSNVHEIGIAAGLYAGDTDDHFPHGLDMIDKFTTALKGTPFETIVPTYPLVNEVLMPYTKSRQVFRCPEDSGMYVADLTFLYPLDTTPSTYGKYGSSYRWNSEMDLRGLTFAGTPNPSRVDLLSDASGSWHAGLRLTDSNNADDFPTQSLRYNAGYVDLHARSCTHDELVDANWELQL